MQSVVPTVSNPLYAVLSFSGIECSQDWRFCIHVSTLISLHHTINSATGGVLAVQNTITGYCSWTLGPCTSQQFLWPSRFASSGIAKSIHAVPSVSSSFMNSGCPLHTAMSTWYWACSVSLLCLAVRDSFLLVKPELCRNLYIVLDSTVVPVCASNSCCISHYQKH